jgi:cysteinyl-tRNA synthetase
VRLYLVSHRYRRDWEFSWLGLAQAARLIDRVRALLAEEARGAGGPHSAVVVGAGPALRASDRAGRGLVAEFTSALEDDLDTPRAVRTLRAAIRRRDAAAVRWMMSILVGTASLS